MDQEINSKQQSEVPREKRLFRLSTSDAGWFAIVYAIGFVVFRFDIRRHGRSFQHPMTTVSVTAITQLTD